MNRRLRADEEAPDVALSDDDDEEASLRAAEQGHQLFRGKDKMQAASGYHEHWPHGRGVFHNPDKTFVNWVNEGDHLRIISMQNGGDVKAVFSRLSAGAKAIEDGVRAETKAEGEAESARLVGKAIQDNPGFVKLRKIDTAKEIATTVARNQGKVYLNSDSLLINVLGEKNLADDETKKGRGGWR